MTVYTCKNYNVYKVDNSFIVHNTDKEFKNGHTHINNFNTAKYIIKLSIHRSIPRHLSIYLLYSLIRINTDKFYIEKIQNLLDIKNNKTKNKYININKGR